MNPEINKAMVVEDDELMRGLIQVVLNSCKVTQVVEAKDGADAIEALKHRDFRVVIMDWRMAVMDGLECTRRIRAGIDGIDRDIPIILLTGVREAGAEDEAYEAGVDLFLEKPFCIKTLRNGIVKTLNAKGDLGVIGEHPGDDVEASDRRRCAAG